MTNSTRFRARRSGLLVALAAALSFAAIAGGNGAAAKPAGKGSAAKGSAAKGSGSASGSSAGAGSGSVASTGSGSASGSADTQPQNVPPPPPPNPDDLPVNLRLRKIEQRVQALKQKSWQTKAEIAMIKEAVIGGGIGAQASITHENNMGASFRLIKLVYALDGTQVFTKVDDDAETLYKEKSFDIVTGPIAPGSHTISVLAVYRGHGYGVFKYLEKYTYTVRSSHTFTVAEGKATKVTASAYEKGKANTPMDKRPAIDFKVEQVEPEKAAPEVVPPPAGSGAPAPAPTTTTPAGK
jgi:hypothetical protein